MINYIVIFITLVAALIASLSQILFKSTITERFSGVKSVIRIFKKKKILLGLFGYVVSLIIYLFALKAAPLSVIYPTFASSFIFIVLFATLFLKEKITGARLVGVFLIFVGIFMISLTI